MTAEPAPGLGFAVFRNELDSRENGLAKAVEEVEGRAPARLVAGGMSRSLRGRDSS